MIKGGGADFFGSTTENGASNQAKPVFGQYALELSRMSGSFTWVEPYLRGLENFYSRWNSRYGSPCGLLVWGSDVAIGVDNDPATYGRPEFSSANLLLNCLFHSDLLAAADIYTQLGRLDDARRIEAQAGSLAASVRKECWDRIDGFFYSVDVQVRDERDRFLPGLKKGMDISWLSMPIKIKMFTGFLPLWCGIATPEQARDLVKHLQCPAKFDAAFGVPSLAMDERMYAPGEDSANPSNWLGPIWIVANYMIYTGLLRYGYQREAEEIAEKILRLLNCDLKATGCLHECYHPETGTPNFNAHFLSWNVLALTMDGRSPD